MASPHVPLPRALRVPALYGYAPGYLELHDPDLRLRKSIDRPGTFVLERRVRRAPAIRIGLPNGSDIHVQARDGYLHVGRVHVSWLLRPWNIIRALKQQGGDLWAEGGAKKFDDADQYEQAWLKENRRRHTRENFRALAREMFDDMDRQGSPEGRTERTRISNVGLPPRVTRQQRRSAQRAGAKAKKQAARWNRATLRA